jgi:hypothetical protein
MWIERLTLEGEAWVWKPVQENFDLEKDFSIDESNLNGEICRMGQLLVRYGGIDAEQNANLRRKEENAKLVRARVSGALRSDAEANGKKMTVQALEDETLQHASYQQALTELHILRAAAIKADHWWRSIVKKTDLLNAMAFRQNAEIKRMAG